MIEDAIEVAAKAAFIAFSRRPDADERWDRKVPELVKEQFRDEQRDAFAALAQAGFQINRRDTAYGEHHGRAAEI